MPDDLGCRDLTDYRRASEWIELTDRWCERQSVGEFPGVCGVHRAEIAVVQGDWQRAEEELRQATRELEKFEAIPPMADGLYAIGEIRRLRGDLAGAEEVVRQAHALGGARSQRSRSFGSIGQGEAGRARRVVL